MLSLSYAFLDHERFYKASQSLLIHTSKQDLFRNWNCAEDERDESAWKVTAMLPDTLPG